MKIIFDETRPIYLQIMEEIKREIARGNLKKGEKLFSVRELAKDIEVNPNTVQRAYLELEREGILVSKRGQGTFITEEEKVIENIKRELTEQIIMKTVKELISLGFSPREIKEHIEKSLEDKL